MQRYDWYFMIIIFLFGLQLRWMENGIYLPLPRSFISWGWFIIVVQAVFVMVVIKVMSDGKKTKGLYK